MKGKLKKFKGAVTPEEWNKLSNKEREKRFKLAWLHLYANHSFGDLIDNAIEYKVPIPTEIDDKGEFIWEGFEGMV